MEQLTDSDLNNEVSIPSKLDSHTSGSSHVLLTESSYNSDQGSANEDSQESNYKLYEESSDEQDYLVL